MRKLKVSSVRAAALCIVAAVLQLGCASSSVESRRYGNSQETIGRISFVQEDGAGGPVRITKQERGYQPTITEAEKERAAKDFAILNRAFMAGMRDSMPKIAAQHGLTVASPGQSTHTLKIVVFWREMMCLGSHNCKSYMRARGDVIDAQGNVLWYVVAEMGQSNSLQPLSGDVFQPFAETIFDAMKRDGLIAKKR